jgi:hypothetical protein
VVQVLNGSPVAGRAESLAGWLRQSGIGVQGYATADSLSYAHTQVSVAAGAAPAVTGVARDIATLLQAPLVTGSVLKGGAPVVVTIGQDYQSPIQQ